MGKFQFLRQTIRLLKIALFFLLQTSVNYDYHPAQNQPTQQYSSVGSDLVPFLDFLYYDYLLLLVLLGGYFFSRNR